MLHIHVHVGALYNIMYYLHMLHGYKYSVLVAFEVLRKKKCGDWWDISVATNDYETLSVLSKVSGWKCNSY